MATNAPNFANTSEGANPDVTIKVTDDQLNKASAQAKDAIKALRAQSPDEDDDDALSETRTGLTSTSISSFFRFFQRNLLPDLPDRDKTQATILLDNTRTDLNLPADDKVRTDLPEDTALPQLQDVCQLEDAFAEGGQGIISRAIDKSLHRTIAIKSLRKELRDNPALRKSFLTEAMITAQLEHPAIVPIHGLYQDGAAGVHQAMKLVKGHTLKDELQRFITLRKKMGRKITQGVLNRLFNERIDLLLRVCEAVAYAHSRNIIHCDLKPENIMIGEYGEIYVMDWGLARRFRDERGNIIQPPKDAALDGTPRFMPAETFQGRPRDERTDIFAIGLILFEMVTLRHGFSGKNIQEVIQKIRTGQRNPIVNRFGYHLSPDLVAIIDKATAYAPEDRYQHVTELSDDLRRYLDGLAVSARPENLLEKFFRAIKRYSRTLVLLTLVSWIVCGVFITHHLKVLNLQANQDLAQMRTTSEEQADSIRMLDFERHLANMDSKVIRSAIRLSNTLVDLASNLRNVSQRTGGLLASAQTHRDTTGLPIVPYHEITPANAPFSPVYNDHVKPDACSYQVPLGRDPSIIQDQLASLSPITIELRDLVLNSTENFRAKESASSTYTLVQEGLLIRRAYLGVGDTSLHIAYPGNGSYPPDYDNHTRTWYYDAKLQAEKSIYLKPIWGKPYLDTSNKQRVLTCSMPVFSPNQKFLGVVAFDLFFETFSDQLRIDGNGQGPEILDKFLCTSDGTILCHVPINPITPNASDEEVEAQLRSHLSFLFARNQERMTGGYGRFKTQDHQHWVYYHYAYIPGLQLYLIEKSFEAEIQHQIALAQEQMAQSLEEPEPATDEMPEGETAPEKEATPQ